MKFSKNKITLLITATMMGVSPIAMSSEQETKNDMGTMVILGNETDNPKSLEIEADVSKIGVPVEDLPLSVSVVSKEFAKEIGAKNLQDALTYSSGVNAGSYGFDTRIDAAQVRGVSPIQYVDGMKSSTGYYNNTRPSIYTLERIEVLKGPASTVYGQSSVGGIQNSVTKRPQEETSREISLQAGNNNRKQIAGDITGKLDQEGKFRYRVIGLLRDSDTQVDYVEDNEQLFNGSLSWHPNDDTTLTLILNRQIKEGQVSAQFLPSEGTIKEHTLGYIPTSRFVGEPDWDRYDREQTAFTAIFEHKLNDQWSIDARTRYLDSSSEIREHWAAVGYNPDASGNINRTAYQVDKTSDVFTYDVRLNGDLELGSTLHKLTFGLDHQNTEADEDNKVYGSSTFNVFDPVYGNVPSLTGTDPVAGVKTKQTGLYVSDHISINNFILTAALRRDKTNSASESGDYASTYATTKHVGLMYQFDSGISPYVSYSESFNPNTGSDGAGGILKPTEGEQIEVGLKYLSPEKDTAVTFAVYDITQTDRVSQGSTPGGVEQLGAEIQGWEMQVQQDWDQFSVLANLTVLDGENPNNGSPLPIGQLAEKTASIWGNYKFTNGWRSGLGVRYQSENYTGDGLQRVPGVTLVDAMVGYAYGDWDFALNAQNLADKEYVSWCRSSGTDCGFGERRTIALNANYSF